MRYFVVFGNPIHHSKSPLMHNSAFLGLGSDGRYGRYLLDEGKRLKEKIVELGVSGCNITVPFKESAYECSDVLDSPAEKIGAVNTIKVADGKLYGFNTDGEGFFASLGEFQDASSFLIVGAGGTAKSIAFSLKSRNKKIKIVNRSAQRLEFFRANGFDVETFSDFEVGEYDVVVNSTSAGLESALLPLDSALLGRVFEGSKLAYDCIYGKVTPFLDLAAQKGNATKDGKSMLINQGVLAFQIFTDSLYDAEDVKKYMTKALA